LNEIGATKSSKIIEQAVELLSNYPDGVMNGLYRKYAGTNRNEIE
jgi:hypothetical protein